MIHFNIFGYPLMIHSSGLFYALGLGVGTAVWWWLAKRAGLEYKRVLDYIFGILFFGFLGARLMYVLEFGEHFENVWQRLAFWQGGLVFFGGFIFASIYLVVQLYISQREKFWQWLDTALMAAVLGQAVGRISCFLNGDSYGIESRLPWAVSFPVLGDGVLRHPTQIYEMLAYLFIFAVLLYLYQRRKRDGEVLFGGLILYSLARFLIEFLRYHSSGELLLNNLSYSQLISLVLLFGGLAGLVYVKKVRLDIVGRG